MQSKHPFDNPADSYAYAYVRLSRPEELDSTESLDEKFAVRSAICRRLAANHGLLLPDENIIVEQKSASKLQSRPGAMKLLGLAHERRLPNLITPYIDRLLRGDKRDEQDIEDALVLGRVRVFTTEQPHPIVFDADYDPTLFEIKSFIARSELRGTIKKRRMADAEKTDRGQRVRGHAPYGYRYLRPTFDEYGRRVTGQRHEVIPEEWPIVLEIFRRAKDESLRSICLDLDRRGIPPPGTGRRSGPSLTWRHGSMRQIILNPFYAGYLSQQARIVRGKRVAERAIDFKLATVKGDWQTVHTIEEWQEIAARYASNQPSAGGPGKQAKVVSGLLFNWCGLPMYRARTTWECRCGDPEHGGPTAGHHGTHITDLKISSYVASVVLAILRDLPPDVMKNLRAKTPGNADTLRRTNAARLAQVNRELADRRRDAEEMMLRSVYFIANFGQEQFETAAAKVKKSVEALTVEATILQATVAESAAPEPSVVLPMLLRLRESVIDGKDDAEASAAWIAYWLSTEETERRTLTRMMIRRIQLQEPPGKVRGKIFCPGADTSIWAWILALLPPGWEPPPMQLIYRRPNYDWHESRRRAKEKRAEKAAEIEGIG